MCVEKKKKYIDLECKVSLKDVNTLNTLLVGAWDSRKINLFKYKKNLKKTGKSLSHQFLIKNYVFLTKPSLRLLVLLFLVILTACNYYTYVE